MITTVDGVVKNPGDTAYMISYAHLGSKHYPFKFTVDEEDGLFEHSPYYHDKNICQEQCNLMNQDNKI